MKKLFVFVVFILSLVVLQQCQKSEIIKENTLLEERNGNGQKENVNKNDEISKSVTDETKCRLEELPDYHCTIKPDMYIAVYIDGNEVGIPQNIIGNCFVFVHFDIKECKIGNSNNYDIEFTDFRLFMPQGGDCGTLNTYLADLESADPDAYDDLMEVLRLYVANKAKRQYMSNFVAATPINCNNYAANAYMYMKLCYKKCQTPPKLIVVCGPQVGNDGCEDPRYVLVGSEIEFLKCGDGCCLSEQSYCYDFNEGQVVEGYRQTTQIGLCDEDDPLNVICLGEIQGGPFCIMGGCE